MIEHWFELRIFIHFFLQADPKLLEAVEGLDPDQEKHQFFMDLQPVS